jgi:hypothetical protein
MSPCAAFIFNPPGRPLRTSEQPGSASARDGVFVGSSAGPHFGGLWAAIAGNLRRLSLERDSNFREGSLVFTDGGFAEARGSCPEGSHSLCCM